MQFLGELWERIMVRILVVVRRYAAITKIFAISKIINLVAECNHCKAYTNWLQVEAPTETHSEPICTW